MQKWEYVVVETDSVGSNVYFQNRKELYKPEGGYYYLHDYLKNVGEKGWEVVTSLGDKTLILKRPIEE